jgi:hypothetical protein
LQTLRDSEAQIVRSVFRRYAELGSVRRATTRGLGGGAQRIFNRQGISY